MPRMFRWNWLGVFALAACPSLALAQASSQSHTVRKGDTLWDLARQYRNDPFLWPGLSDLTAHVDFTAVAEAGVRGGLDVAGFASQASFLLSLGILDRLGAVGRPESVAYIEQASAVQKLLSPAEMGELFKVLALASDDAMAWPGFAMQNRRGRL